MTENQMSPDLFSRIPSADTPQVLLPANVVVNEEQGQMARYLLDFKSGREPQTTQWIRLASLVASHSFSCDIVVRALAAKEKVAGGATPLDKLGAAIARKTNAKYCPARLQRVDAGPDSPVQNPDSPEAAAETYRFDKSFLPATARVLVVGDVDTTEAAFEAITGAIRETLPRAEVKVFTLAWVGEHLKDEKINGQYFTTSVSPLSVLQKEEPAPPVPVPEVNAGLFAPAPAESVPEENVEPPAESPAPAPAVVTSTPTPHPLEPDRLPVRGRTGHHPSVPFKVRTRTGSAAVTILLTGAGILLVTSAIMLFAKKPAPLEAATFNALPVIEEPVVVPEKVLPPPPPPAAPKKPHGPQGIVTVPRAGLRAGHSPDAKPVRGTVRNNERVTILKRHYGDAGPGWVQIETQSGNVGWVWAAVVRELKAERVTKQ
jgi:adenine/guanine phosphoribosyltransferase-like PRPP-binding protein